MFSALLAMWRRWFGSSKALEASTRTPAEPVAVAREGSPSPSDDALAEAPGASTGPSAREVMEAMKRGRGTPADRQAWTSGMATFKSRVFSRPDRARLWRRARRRYDGDLVELDLITAPTSHDLEALEDLLRELSR